MMVTVSIITKNRRDELRETVHSALSQSMPIELLVLDDGSTDGTAEMIRTEFPTVRLERSESSLGYIVGRNCAALMATGEIIFSIDDDAVFTSPHIVEQTLREFVHPCIGAVAIPYMEPRKSPIIYQKAPSEDEIFVTNSFIGTAHALRKDVFLELGGYREHLVHQGEESDFAIRMLEAGYVVRLGNADPIHHMESLRRDLLRMDHYGCRNAVLFAWSNVPWLGFPLHIVATTVNCLRWSLKPTRFLTRLKGVLAGYRDCFKYPRRPVSIRSYLQFRSLSRHAQRFDDIVARS